MPSEGLLVAFAFPVGEVAPVTIDERGVGVAERTQTLALGLVTERLGDRSGRPSLEYPIDEQALLADRERVFGIGLSTASVSEIRERETSERVGITVV